jgi:hypothetical protein
MAARPCSRSQALFGLRSVQRAGLSLLPASKTSTIGDIAASLAQSFYGKVVGWDVQDASGVWGSPGLRFATKGSTQTTANFPVRICCRSHLKVQNNLCLLIVILIATGSVALSNSGGF